MPTPELSRLVERAGRLAEGRGRVVIGIVGPPGSGKSTLAGRLARRITAAGIEAVQVPMDGFHLPQTVLEARGIADAKGAPHTFNAAAFAGLLRRLRAGGEVLAPDFDRVTDEPVPGAIAVPASARVVVTEGNWLLDLDEPWPTVTALLDEVWFTDLDENRRRSRLVDRHVTYGRSREAAQAWVDRVDQPNAERVLARRDAAHLVIKIGP